jgi:hypothetical protein
MLEHVSEFYSFYLKAEWYSTVWYAYFFYQLHSCQSEVHKGSNLSISMPALVFWVFVVVGGGVFLFILIMDLLMDVRWYLLVGIFCCFWQYWGLNSGPHFEPLHSLFL